MPNDSFGFSSKKKGTLDLTGIPKGPPEVSPEREAAAIQRGEELGYVRREASVSVGEAVSALQIHAPAPAQRVTRQRVKRNENVRTVFVRGPEQVIDEFIAYVNEKGYGSYWEALRHLMDLDKAK